MQPIRICLLLALFFGRALFGQTSGDAAVQTAKDASSNDWQNWVFMGSLLLTAASGIIVVSLNTGNSSSSISTTH